MFGREVEKYERIKRNKFVSKLLRPLACHFDNCRVALGSNCLSQKFLKEKSSRHCHLEEIPFAFLSNFESNRACESRLVSRRFKNCIHEFCRRTFSFCASNSNDANVARREAVKNGAKERELPMIERLEKRKNFARNYFFSHKS